VGFHSWSLLQLWRSYGTDAQPTPRDVWCIGAWVLMTALIRYPLDLQARATRGQPHVCHQCPRATGQEVRAAPKWRVASAITHHSITTHSRPHPEARPARRIVPHTHYHSVIPRARSTHPPRSTQRPRRRQRAPLCSSLSSSLTGTRHAYLPPPAAAARRPPSAPPHRARG
jgi:hypothetical protein